MEREIKLLRRTVATHEVFYCDMRNDNERLQRENKQLRGGFNFTNDMLADDIQIVRTALNKIVDIAQEALDDKAFPDVIAEENAEFALEEKENESQFLSQRRGAR